MGSEELLAALRHEGEKKVALIREEAEAAAARLRSEAAARLAQLREESAQKQAGAVRAEQRAAAVEAGHAARDILLAAEQRLAQRLFTLALTLLPRIRDAEYPAFFARLAGELPSREWETLQVNPADLELAAILFARARTVPDPAISGGMDALAQGGRLRVINTLEKRLERGWTELLPLILEEVEKSA